MSENNLTPENKDLQTDHMHPHDEKIKPLEKPSKKKLLVSLAAVGGIALVIFGGTFGFSAYMSHEKAIAMKEYSPAPQVVTTAEVKTVDWQPNINLAGSAAAVQGIQVTAQASGLVSSISFQAGQIVKQGQELFRLNTQQLEAQLQEAKAQLRLAEITYKRYLDLVKTGSVSQQTFDESEAKYQEAVAQVQSIQANIDYHIVRAPFDGMIGIRNISLGQFFNQGDNAATLTMINPIYINFQVPQNYMNNVQVGTQITFTADAYPGKTFRAKVTALNSAIGLSNRSITVQATFDNSDESNLIMPGMFVNVSVLLPEIKDAVVMPRTSVSYSLYGELVYVLEPVMKDGKQVDATYSKFQDGKMTTISMGKPLYTAHPVSVKTSATRDNLVIVEGLKPGEIIATSGQNKLQKGTPVVSNNTYNFSNKPRTHE